MDLPGRRVLITGASRGIGEAMARAFAGAGATVALVARSAEAIDSLAGELGGTAHPADLADSAQLATLIHRVEDQAGPVDVLVNNAGTIAAKSFADLTAEELAKVIQVDLLAPAELCRQAIPRMLRRGAGHIVNISSLAAAGTFPGIVAYSATKAGLSHLTAGLRADLRGRPVRTTLVELGPSRTDMLEAIERYEPTARSFERSYRLKLLVEVPPEEAAAQVVGAVEKNRAHLRLPRRAAPLGVMAEAPRKVVEILLRGVPHQPG